MFDQAGEERIAARGDVRLHRPIFLGAEGLDFDLALDDEA